jgi:hypothetical protein
MTESETIVIARYSLLTMPLFLVLVAAMAGCCIWGGWDSGYDVVTWAGGLFGMTIPLFTLLLIFWRGRAIQIKGGKLLYGASFIPRRIGIHEVEDVRIEIQQGVAPFSPSLTMIAVKGRGRWWSFIPAFLLADDADIVVARLRDALGLPKTA